MSEEPGCSIKPYPFELLNHLTLPVILDIQTNPPNDSIKTDQQPSRNFRLLFRRVNAVSRTRFHLGRITETQRTKCTLIQKSLIIAHILRGKESKPHLLVALANRNAK